MQRTIDRNSLGSYLLVVCVCAVSLYILEPFEACLCVYTGTTYSVNVMNYLSLCTLQYTVYYVLYRIF